MGVKSYFAGLASCAALGGLIWFFSNVNDYRGDIPINEIKIPDATIKIVEEDRQFTFNDYRVDIFDANENLRVSSHYYSLPQIKYISGEGSETEIDLIR